jgi:hypothetical protein
MAKRPVPPIITCRGKKYVVLQNDGQTSERYPFAEWEKHEAKLRRLRDAAATFRLSPAEEASLKKYDL